MSWKTFVMPWGKHKGWTMFQIYVNDYSYISDFLLGGQITDKEVIEAARAAKEHKGEVDPYSKD